MLAEEAVRDAIGVALDGRASVGLPVAGVAAFIAAVPLHLASIAHAPNSDPTNGGLRPEREGRGVERHLRHLLPAPAPLQTVAVQPLRHVALAPQAVRVPGGTALHDRLEGARLSLADLFNQEPQLMVDTPPHPVLPPRLVQTVEDLLGLLLRHAGAALHAGILLKRLAVHGRRLARLSFVCLQQCLQVGGRLRGCVALATQ
mmetsp:Transcript_5939/g.18709  ORF Transcript_5939/g.18709 Transcript_5939/m.18709 type:complete len:202 (+) Transcript_5939:438-1043(+)